MKPVNWISATGFSPSAAMPIATPAMAASASGVSMTRSAPKRACRRTVARNTPPLTPISSPSSTTLGSRASSWASARLTASTRLISAMTLRAGAEPQRGLALLPERGGQRGVKMIEHHLGPRRRDGQGGFHGLIDGLGAFAEQRFFALLAPGAGAHEVVT